MEVRGEVSGVMVIDDFAHHPTAIAETLRAVRVRFRVDAFGRFSSRGATPRAGLCFRII